MLVIFSQALFFCTRQPASLLDFVKHPYEQPGFPGCFCFTEIFRPFDIKKAHTGNLYRV